MIHKMQTYCSHIEMQASNCMVIGMEYRRVEIKRRKLGIITGQVGIQYRQVKIVEMKHKRHAKMEWLIEICSYLEGTNESSCDDILGIEHLYLHHLVKHNVRMLLEVVVQYLVCECVAEGWMRNGNHMSLWPNQHKYIHLLQHAYLIPEWVVSPFLYVCVFDLLPAQYLHYWVYFSTNQVPGLQDVHLHLQTQGEVY